MSAAQIRLTVLVFAVLAVLAVIASLAAARHGGLPDGAMYHTGPDMFHN